MTGFLSSLKADLLDRRLLPLVVVVGLALAGAIAYAAVSGRSSTTAPAVVVAAGPVATPPAGLSVSQSSPEKAVAEVTAGASGQHRGTARDPFNRLPEPSEKKSTATSTAASSASSSASVSSSSSSASSGSSSSEPSPAKPAPAKPAKPKTVYHVAVLFGAVAGVSTPQTLQLTPYENLKLLTPLPSAGQPLIVFRGVTAGGKSATFTLVGEAILHGRGVCLPSAAQCEAIDLTIGESEQFEYLAPGGQPITYELNIVSITSTKASSAGVKNVLRRESTAGRKLLGSAGLLAIPGLRSSSQPGVLVFSGHPAFAAGAHAAARPHHSR